MSNKVLTDQTGSGTGTWLSALADSLIESDEIELGNVSDGKNPGLRRLNRGKLSQYLVSPKANDFNRTGLPSQSIVNDIVRAVEDFSPDLIHVWGTELSWGLITARSLAYFPALLEMQGLKSAIAKVYDGGLSFKEKIACIGLKEFLRQTTFFQGKAKYERWTRFEKEIISGHAFITTQTPWLEARVRAINKSCRIFHNEFTLQESFYSATPWHDPDNENIFCSTSYPSPFKGLHIAIRAIALLKERFPGIQLRIAGAHQKNGIRQDGFVRWLNHEARRLGIENNLYWLGPLSVEGIRNELQNCTATLLPTFVEGYSLSLAEAMMVGSPTVVSFTGGTSYLARDGETALFFPPGDEAMCAYQVERLLLDRTLAERLSIQSRQKALERNNRDRITQQQLYIYRQVIEETEKNGR